MNRKMRYSVAAWPNLLVGFFGYWGLIVVAGGAVALAPSFAKAQPVPTALYSFTGGIDGASPVGGVVADSAGTLYGETEYGGGAACTVTVGRPAQGCGVVYRFNQASGLKVLATFTGPNGAYGEHTLALIGTTLYGTTNNGGKDDDGVIFSVNTNGSNFTILHQFGGADGKNPTGTLVASGANLYGITFAGGAANGGVLFSITPAGGFSLIHSFAGGHTDGAQPFSLVSGPGGVLIGSSGAGGPHSPYCTGGCGVVFEYTPKTGAYSIPYFFGTATGFSGYLGSVASGPTVYAANEGYVFSLNQTSGATILGSFYDYDEGAISSGPVLSKTGALIGVTGAGPVVNGGEIYSVANGVLTVLILFGGTSGADPSAQPILLANGAIIGTAANGALCSYCGTIWEYVP